MNTNVSNRDMNHRSQARTRTGFLQAALLLGALTAALPLFAQVPQLINYQGRLVISGTNYDGAAQFKFALVDAAGATTFWSNDGSSSGGAPPATAVPLTVTKGLYAVLLGDTNLAQMTVPITAAVFSGSDVRLRVWFSDGVSPFLQLTPDQRISAVGYALVAQSAQSAATAGSATNFSGALAGDVTGAQSATVVGAVGGVSAVGVASGANAANSAASANTAGALVKRDGSGNFSAGTITASLAGNATTATTAATANSATTATSATTFTAPLSGDVVGTQGATLVGFVGGVPAPNVASGANAANAAASANTPSTIVRRDASGNFSAGTITAATFSGGGGGLSGVVGTLPWQVISGTSQQAESNKGYVANDPAQVTITLPAAPAVGDIVAVSGAGAGGWKIAQNAGQSILAGNIVSSGSTWGPRAPTLVWRTVASSADGTKLIAGPESGQIYASTDSGVSWSPHGPSPGWSSSASSADGSKLVAASYNSVYTSSDSGTNWTLRSPAAYCVASSADGKKLVTAHPGSGIYTSTDSGTNWTSRGLSFINWNSTASSADGAKLVAVATSGQIYTSTDSGTNWISRSPASLSWLFVACSSDGIRLVAVAYNQQIYVSTDAGITWGTRESARSWYGVASSADGMKLVAVAYGGQIYVSSDGGSNWLPRESNRNWFAVASSADGLKLVAAEYGSGGGGRLYTSSVGVTPGAAGYLTGAQGSAIQLQYLGNNQFMPLSSSGAISAY